ncbi:MAG: DNA polymerase I [Cyanobacteria bacterium SIG30]|nr:DNA polymerase I [Cyanobacteria bacterium SIG30]
MREGKKTLILIDGHALAFRMFFALERTNMQTTEHTPTWAVYGFFKAVFDLLRNSKINPNAIAVAFDVSKKTFRLEKYEHYKENRLTMPDSLRTQLGLIIEGLNALNIPIYTKEGFEGDDIIGTVAQKGIKEGFKTYILTGDKDSFQLINEEEDVCVLIPSKGELVYYDWNMVYEKMGVYPNQIVDYKALCGDTSDNIPGVRGIGPKTACSLLEKYKTLDEIYNNIDEIKGAVNTKLVENKEMAYLSQFLATIERKVDIDFDFKKACLDLPNKNNLLEFFKKVQFFGFIKNIDKLLETFNKDDSKNCASQDSIVKFDDVKETQGVQLGMFDVPVDNFEKELGKYKEISNDEMLSQISEGDKIALYLNENTVFLAKDYLVSKFEPSVLNDISKNANIKKVVYDLKNTLNVYPDLAGVYCDVALSSYVKDPSRKHDLITQMHYCLQAYFFNELNDKFLAPFMLKLAEFYDEHLNEDEKKILTDIEIPLSYVLFSMEKRGVSIDVEYLNELSLYIKSEMKKLEDKIFQTAGMEFNIKSPKQVSQVLFEKLEIKPKKKNKSSGEYSTSAKILEEIAEDYEIAKDIIQYRQLTKLLTSYVDTLPELVKEDDRVHTHFNQIVTNTGRLSSSDPNLQNIPIRTELGNRIRKAFVPKERENALILSADYSQIELRLMAHFSNDSGLIDIFNSNDDIHVLTASKIFDVEPNEVTKDMRRKAKAVNFGIIYGQTRWGLASSLNITPFEAQEFIDKYFKSYPNISLYINSTIMQAHQEGFVTTLFGRKRYLNEELNSRNAKIREFAQRAAINAPLQGSAADLIKIAMIKLDDKLKTLKSKIIMQVHDELVVEVYKDELEIVKQYVKEAMELDQPLMVPLVVDIQIGESWKDE